MEFASVVVLVLGVGLGFALGWLLRKNKAGDEVVAYQPELERENAGLKALMEEKEKRLLAAEKVFHEQKEALLSHTRINSASEAEIKNLKEKLDGQKEEMNKLQEKFTLEFENLATKILKSNTSEFAESNQKRLDQILDPLKEKIVSFEKQVQEKYIDEAKERSKLEERIIELTKLSHTMSEEAHNLTTALKGDNKTQGNWGEMVLERILEASGLEKGREYTVQHSTENWEGSRIQPDVVINLPDDKHIIVDSKVSLTAYQQLVSAEHEEDRQRFVKAHVLSLKSHIKSLSEKNYQSAKGVNSPDFVLLFMNSEPGFSTALKADQELWAYAWERKIVLVTPSTLLATLRTISSIWKHERQTQNAIDIAEQSGRLYDKFVGFVEDLEKVKRGINQSNDAYEAAMNKLKNGSGNLIGRVEKIKKLGAKTNKSLSRELLNEESEEELEQ
jgi:DNA recombination protein RmuC